MNTSEEATLRSPSSVPVGGYHLAFLLVIVLVGLVVNWPSGADFKADDYPAIAYASQFENCLHDFHGSQYGLSFFLFYRPLITVSLYVDHLLFGTEAFGYLFMNCLACVFAALLLYAIVCSLVRTRFAQFVAFSLALLWICHPVLVTSLRWVVGRVDTHVAPLILLALFLHLRYRRGGLRWPVWVAALMALSTKESAIGLPLLALGLDFLDPDQASVRGREFLGVRLSALPYLALLPAFFLFRWIVLGKAVGGYGFHEASFKPWQSLHGLWTTYSFGLFAGLPPAIRHLLAAASLAALGRLLWRRKQVAGARLLGILLLGAGLYAPLAPILPSMRDPNQQRYASLAMVFGLLTWLAFSRLVARNRVLPFLAFALLPLVWLLPQHGQERSKMDAHDSFNASLLSAMKECASSLPPGVPVVLGGDAELANHPQRFLWGLGSVLKPPFHSPAREVVSLRKLDLSQETLPVTLADLRAGLSSWVLVSTSGGRVATAQGKSFLPAKPVNFASQLSTVVLNRMLADHDAVGYELSAGYDGRVLVCTSVGSYNLAVASRGAEGKQLSLYAILLPRIFQLWNAMDLAPASPLFFYWREGEALRQARLRLSKGIARQLIPK